MGAWSADSYGNDTACDWAYGLDGMSDLDYVRQTIQTILNTAPGAYLEGDQAEEAIAAIEVIARLKGNYGVSDAYTEEIDNWVKDHPQQPPADLVAAAVQALDRILTAPSELMELWEESDGFEAWRESVLDLKQRAGE